MKNIVIIFVFAVVSCTSLSQDLKEEQKYDERGNSKLNKHSAFIRSHLRSSVDHREGSDGHRTDVISSLSQYLRSLSWWWSESKHGSVGEDDDKKIVEYDDSLISDESLVRYLQEVGDLELGDRFDDDSVSCMELTRVKKKALRERGGKKSKFAYHHKLSGNEAVAAGDDRIYKLNFDEHICPAIGPKLCAKVGDVIKRNYNAGLLNCNNLGFLFEQNKRTKLKKWKQARQQAALSAAREAGED